MTSAKNAASKIPSEIWSRIVDALPANQNPIGRAHWIRPAALSDSSDFFDVMFANSATTVACANVIPGRFPPAPLRAPGDNTLSSSQRCAPTPDLDQDVLGKIEMLKQACQRTFPPEHPLFQFWDDFDLFSPPEQIFLYNVLDARTETIFDEKLEAYQIRALLMCPPALIAFLVRASDGQMAALRASAIYRAIEREDFNRPNFSLPLAVFSGHEICRNPAYFLITRYDSKRPENILKFFDRTRLGQRTDALLRVQAYAGGASPNYLLDGRWDLSQRRERIVADAKIRASTLRYVSPSFLEDPAFVLDVVLENPSCFLYVPQHLLNDPEINRVAVENPEYAFNLFPPSARAEPHVVLDAVQRWPWAIANASEALRSDKTVVLAAIRAASTRMLEPLLFDEELRNSREFLDEAARPPAGFVSQVGIHLGLVDKAQRLSQVLHHFSRDFLFDREMTMHAIKQDGRVLLFVMLERMPSQEEVLEALETAPDIFRILPQVLFADPEIALKALVQEAKLHRQGSHISYSSSGSLGRMPSHPFFNHVFDPQEASRYNAARIPQELFDNLDFTFEALCKNSSVYRFLPTLLRERRDVVLHAVAAFAEVFREIPSFLQVDREIALAALKKDFRLFSQLPSALRDEHDFVQAALRTNPLVYLRFDRATQLNPTIVLDFLWSLFVLFWHPKRSFEAGCQLGAAITAI